MTAVLSGPCPLCGDGGSSPSAITIRWDSADFRYWRCHGCGSLFCVPMPTGAQLSRMYGLAYESAFTADAQIEDPKQPARLLRELSRRPRGRFVDYGCGAGNLVRAARDLGWQAFGVEHSPAVVEQLRAEGVEAFTTDDASALDGTADLVHLGDVVEHLTNANAQVARALRLLRRGGVLVAQGPLEGNANVFNAVVRLVHGARRRASTMPPYHVLLATARGQLSLFERLQLETVTFDVFEVDWPAPARLPTRGAGVRAIGLFALRRISRLATSLRRARWGNRYFYVGLHSADQAR